MAGLILLAFLAGILTVLAPCVIPILPVILGSSTTEKSWKKPLIIILSLAVSIFVLTLGLKLIADSIGFNPTNFKFLTVMVLTLYGLILIFPKYWDSINVRLGLASKSDGILHRFSQRSDLLGYALVGLALGPVFNSCSPTYLLLILPLLEQNLGEGIIYLFFYLLGLILILSLIAMLGFKLTKKIRWAYDPNGKFRKILGIVFIIIAISIAFGIDKQIEIYLLSNTDFYLKLTDIEILLKEKL
jgi:cytochrome c-type biogenesis protein